MGLPAETVTANPPFPVGPAGPLEKQAPPAPAQKSLHLQPGALLGATQNSS